jgi:hypothetical protein
MHPDATRGSLFGAVDEVRCTPWFGPPAGASPACNRVLLETHGTASFTAPWRRPRTSRRNDEEAWTSKSALSHPSGTTSGRSEATRRTRGLSPGRTSTRARAIVANGPR